MSSSLKFEKFLVNCSIVILMLNILSCASIPERQIRFDVAKVTSIVVEIPKSEVSILSDLPQTDIMQQVRNNLVSQGYPITVNKDSTVSHVLSATVQEQLSSSTPVGFSFTAGNSDPRALQFQKAVVLPITCQLFPIDEPDLQAELTLEVLVDDYLNFDKEPKASKQRMALLIDDISTSCFNLLSALKVQTKETVKTDEETVQPTWIPQIRVETEMPSPHESNETNVEHNTIERKTRKRIIIHNQGSPIIFKFGHERK